MTEMLINNKESLRSAFRDFIFIMFHRSQTAVLVFGIIFMASLLGAALLPPLYCSSAKFMLNVPYRLNPEQSESLRDIDRMMNPLLKAQRELLLSERVLGKVSKLAVSYGLANHLPVVLDELRSKLKLMPVVEESEFLQVFQLSFYGHDSRTTAEIAKLTAKVYQDTYNAMWKERYSATFDLLNEQAEKLAEEMAAKEKALRQFETKGLFTSTTTFPDLELTDAYGKLGPQMLLTDVLKRYYELQGELAALRVTVETLEQDSADRPPPGKTQAAGESQRNIAALKSQIKDFQVQLDQMRSQLLREDSPKTPAGAGTGNILMSIGNPERDGSLRNQKVIALAMEAKVAELGKVIQNLQDAIRLEAQNRSTYEHLRHEYELARNEYLQARNRMEGVRLASTLNMGREALTLLDEPTVPPDPITPNRFRIILYGFLTGLLAAVLAALILDYFDHTIKKPLDIDYYLGVECLGSIPKVT